MAMERRQRAIGRGVGVALKNNEELLGDRELKSNGVAFSANKSVKGRRKGLRLQRRGVKLKALSGHFW